MGKRLKRTISAALACLLLLTLLPLSALAAAWENHWSAEYIQTAVDHEWIEVDEAASGGEAITRADFAVIVWKVLEKPEAQADCPFADVTAAEVRTAAAALYEKGIVNGTGAAAFSPDKTLTRQEAITMLARAFALTADNANAAAGFADWADVADWARNAVAAMVENGYVNGVGGNRLAPVQPITLGEMCKLLAVICEDLSSGDDSDGDSQGTGDSEGTGDSQGTGDSEGTGDSQGTGDSGDSGNAAVPPPTTISADQAIVSVQTIGFVDNDGAKVAAIAVEYSVNLRGADIDVSDYEVWTYGQDQKPEIGSDPGKALKAYVNNEAAVSENGGTGSGKYVIIEVNTDYQLGGVPGYVQAMAADVLQTGTLRAANYTVTPGTEKVGNYNEVEVTNRGQVQIQKQAIEGAYTIVNIEGFRLFTKEDGTAFHATGCFEEATGEYVDVDLPYALYVPEDYDADKEYALVIQIHDAGAMGDDPMITLTESQGSANFASAEVQQIVKDQGLAGLIVVSPQICDALRSTRDNWSLSAAVPATWQLLDYLTETYSIDMDHIYGTGQSMGGMQVVAMAAQRDNYFAGVWANGCQWGTNYNLEEPYNGASYYPAPADGELIWTVDADGNEVDYRNWYYMISDDNVLITNCAGDAYSTQTWKELDFLYHDLAGTELIYDNYKAIWNPLTATVEEQNAAATAIMEKAAAESGLGFVWTAFEGGNHMATWIYSHGVFAHYEWLLTQSRQDEMDRDKLKYLTNNFEYADEQDTGEARQLAPGADGMVYYATGALGAGTADYNGCWLKMGNSVIKEPNWKPTVVKAEDAVEKVSTIAFVDVDGPKVQAIVVEYNTELLAGSVDLDTYEAYTYANLPQVFDIAKDNGGPKEGEEANQPYEAYPTFELLNGTPGAPTKVYVSATPAIDPEGVGDESGKYVIIEVNTDYQLAAVSSDWRACVAGGVQQKKIITSADVSIAPTTSVTGNYEPGYFWDINPMGSNHSVTLQKVFDDTLYVLNGIEGYQIYTDNTTAEHTVTHEAISEADRTVTYKVPDATVLSKVAGEAFKATNCFSEYDGQTHDVSLMYSIFVPEDYKEQVAAGKKFALVLHMEDAGALGDDPMIALTEAQAAANYASDRVQQLAKDQGLGGLIVVLPQVPKSGQTMADNLTGNEYVPATWQLLDYITGAFEIDMNRIYASGQSMGGMQVLDMAAQRDNYFAAIWSIGSQWGNNYNKEEPYGMGPNKKSYFTYPTDGTIITNPDWQNWYYSISDDNILVTNMTGDATATGYWNQVVDLFSQFAGVTFPYVEWDPLANSREAQNAMLQALLSEDNELGIYWNALSNGSHKATWIYAHAISDSYDWLLQQTKADEDERGKLEELKGSYAEEEGTYLYNSLTKSAATVAES